MIVETQHIKVGESHLKQCLEGIEKLSVVQKHNFWYQEWKILHPIKYW